VEENGGLFGEWEGTMAERDATEQVKQVWEAVAPAWERHRRQLFEHVRPVSEWLVDHVEPEPGRTILELGCGPGETGFLAAERLGNDGTLISTDVSPSMVDIARRGSADKRLTNVEHRVLDAQEIDLPDDSVDGVLSRFTFMLIPDPTRAFGEVHRVLRPGRPFAYACWGRMDGNPWVTSIIAAILQNGHAPPTGGAGPTEPGGLFSLATAEPNASYLEAAGFSAVAAEEITGVMEYPSFDEYWDTNTSVAGPLAQMLRTLSPDQVEAIRDTTQQLVEPHRVASVYKVPYTVMAVRALA
jgi:ubiquinone/menaquinone biosynthesis C-methylase UbiE